MLPIPPMRSLDETSAVPLTARQQLECDLMVPGIIRIQEYPDLFYERLVGLVVPPHERTMLYVQLLGASTNIHQSSRGTAKSATVLGLSSIHKSLTHSRRNSVLLNATGLRGGQMLYNDCQRFIEGAWDSQEPVPGFLLACMRNPKVITRQPSHWEMKLDSLSEKLVLPTNDPERIRGVRGKDLEFDEALLATEDLIEKVAKHFLTVKGDFRHGGAESVPNTVTFCSTVDYSFRPFQRYVQAARESMERDFVAYKAKQRGDKAKYADMTQFGFATQTFTSFSYVNLIIPTEMTVRDGRRMQFHWPNKDFPVTYLPGGLPFTQRGTDGEMLLRGAPMHGVITYPLDLQQIEGGLYSGAADEASWKAEQRNIADTASGDVYSHALVDRASCVGESVIIPRERLSQEWREAYPEEEGYTAPVLWKCTDPVVIGIDVANGDRDFSAFTVIRIGQLAEGAFNPLTHHGKTTFSSVIWCEQHRRTSHDDVREKLWQLMERYPNVVFFHTPHITDDWNLCRGIGADVRGVGSGVRDALVYMNHDTVPAGRFRIYDPLDPDERVRGYAQDGNAKAMLDAISATDVMNDRLVEFTVGQMQQQALFLPKYLQLSERTTGRECDIAYEASKRLASQLRKLQQEPTARGRTFYMPASRESLEGKKDLWSSFIYAAKQLRAHLIRHQVVLDTPPPMGAVVSRIGSKHRRGINGTAIGAKSSRRR